MVPIKNIILDLGGVLLNINYNKTADAFKSLGVKDFDNYYSQATANELFELLETGKISDADFYKTIGEACHPGTTTEQLQAAWNAILLDFRMESLAELERLGQKYELYLLSNTNSIHLQAFNKILETATGKSSLDSYFKKTYLSHEIGIRKPYAATYNWVLNDSQLAAVETLFIDDSINNIVGAKEAGLQTHLLLPHEKIEDLKL